MMIICCIIAWVILSAIPMAFFGQLDTPKRKLTTKENIFLGTLIGLFAAILFIMYNELYDLLCQIFVVLIFIGIVIYAFSVVFLGRK